MKKKILFGLGGFAILAMLVFSVNVNSFDSSKGTSISDIIGMSKADAEGPYTNSSCPIRDSSDCECRGWIIRDARY